MFITRPGAVVCLILSITACVAQPVRTPLPKNGNQAGKVLAAAGAKPVVRASAAVVPLSRPPRPESPTPLPSGYVSPLPLSAFPSEPTQASVAVLASLKPSRVPTPSGVAASTTPFASATDTPVTAQVIVNNLAPGPATITGVTVLVIPDNAIQPLAGTTVTIRPMTGTQRAELVTGTNGAYQIGGLAQGKYYVSVRKSGYASDPAPTTVTLGTGHLVNVSNFVLLKE